MNCYNEAEFIDLIDVEKNEIMNNLPDIISISTMCASCKLNSNILINNIKEHLKLNINDILSINRKNNDITSLITLKSKKKININKKTFFNQITVTVRISHGYTNDINKELKINVKLFKNGSLQMSGCKSVKDINIILNKLLIILSDKNEDFVQCKENLHIINFKIDMINSNYKTDIKIDRNKLYELLIEKKIKCSYEPCIRACVIIKYVPKINNPLEKEISVFIFQKGNVIITGAKSKNDIIETYNYIDKLLTDHKNDIKKKNDYNEENLLLEIYDGIVKDIANGLIDINS